MDNPLTHLRVLKLPIFVFRVSPSRSTLVQWQRAVNTTILSSREEEGSTIDFEQHLDNSNGCDVTIGSDTTKPEKSEKNLRESTNVGEIKFSTLGKKERPDMEKVNNEVCVPVFTINSQKAYLYKIVKRNLLV